MIVQFFSEHATERRQGWREIYENKRKHDNGSNETDVDQELVKEMSFLKHLAEQEERMSRTYDLSLSLLGFVSFWMFGAAAYHAIEGWTFGDSVYYCYITFFTIGFVSIHVMSGTSSCTSTDLPLSLYRATSHLQRQPVSSLKKVTKLLTD